MFTYLINFDWETFDYSPASDQFKSAFRTPSNIYYTNSCKKVGNVNLKLLTIIANSLFFLGLQYLIPKTSEGNKLKAKAATPI